MSLIISKKQRIDAEKKAQQQFGFATLKQIYSYLDFDPQIEIDMELNHCYPNAQILNMYNENPNNYVFIS